MKRLFEDRRSLVAGRRRFAGLLRSAAGDVRPLVIVLFLAIACGREAAPPATTSSAPPAPPPPPAPTAQQARELIANSPEWSEYEFTNAAYTLQMNKASMNEPMAKTAAELAKAGWIRMRGNEVELTEKAKSDRRFLVRPNGTVDLVPIAKKELLTASEPRPAEEGNLAVDITWKWLPNEVGQAFRSGLVKERFDAEHAAVATLRVADGGWGVRRIERK